MKNAQKRFVPAGSLGMHELLPSVAILCEAALTRSYSTAKAHITAKMLALLSLTTNDMIGISRVRLQNSI